MSTTRTLGSAFLGVGLMLAVVAAPATANAASGAASSQPSIPQVSSALAGGDWLASQVTPQGYVPASGSPDTPDLSATANTILALASAGVDPSVAQNALNYMEQNVDVYVSQDGSDGPGQLALLILDAHALGADPTSFGGTDLVSRLLATQQTSGADAGLFGTEAQVDDYSAGVYQQGLALAALAGTSETSGSQISAAEAWLHAQQCPDGGWTSYENPDNPCNGSPADYEGPDTNSTALAIEGLSAQGALGSRDATRAFKFLVGAQDSDGGWGYEPNAAGAPGTTDPDSTAIVIQAILDLGKSPTEAAFDKQGNNPVATLESFQITSGSGQGAFIYPGSSDPNILATYQAVPAVSGVVFPFDLAVTTSSLPDGTVGARYSTDLAASGGNPPYSWSLVSGSGRLPPGLKLKKAGDISGKPTSTGAYTFTVEVTDTKTTALPHTDNIAWRVLSITV
ncbi:MAG: putative Ig domain-containing protein [Acidimicrobiales bacterium]